jgi:hypothetical protein
LYNCKKFRELRPAEILGLVEGHGLCWLCLTLFYEESKGMHNVCRWKKEPRYQRGWCQKLNKCRHSHNVLLHLDAEDERDLQTARLAKPAEPPDGLKRSQMYDKRSLQ